MMITNARRIMASSGISLFLLGLLAFGISSGANAQVYPSNSFRSASFSPAVVVKAVSSRIARRNAQVNDVSPDVLLATIPASHPLRSELRVIAQQPAPIGYSNAEWLSLAMKFDFRHGTGRPAAQLASQIDLFD